MLRARNQKQASFGLFLCLIVSLLTTFSFAEEKFVYNAKSKRDPFVPLVTPDGMLLNLDREEEATKGLSLEGIMYDKHGMSYAVVNSRVVKVGDEVAGYQVLKIEKDKAIFIKDGQSTVVELKKEGL